jgi:hypothetical protein
LNPSGGGNPVEGVAELLVCAAKANATSPEEIAFEVGLLSLLPFPTLGLNLARLPLPPIRSVATLEVVTSVRALLVALPKLVTRPTSVKGFAFIQDESVINLPLSGDIVAFASIVPSRTSSTLSGTISEEWYISSAARRRVSAASAELTLLGVPLTPECAVLTATLRAAEGLEAVEKPALDLALLLLLPPPPLVTSSMALSSTSSSSLDRLSWIWSVDILLLLSIALSIMSLTFQPSYS